MWLNKSSKKQISISGKSESEHLQQQQREHFSPFVPLSLVFAGTSE